MNDKHQKLTSRLFGKQNLILTSLLSDQDTCSWQDNKHLIISHTPYLTLEMAVNRTCQRAKHSTPTPSQIYAALEYAKAKQTQTAKKPEPLNTF